MKKRVYGKFSIICVKCSKEFFVHNDVKDKSKYCSRKCFIEDKKEQKLHNKNYIKICEFCKKEFFSKVKKSKFCSEKCYIDSKRELTFCAYCKKEFSVRKSRKRPLNYCSKKCRIEGIRKEKIKKICAYCNKEFFVPESSMNVVKFCSKECRINGKKGIIKKCVRCQKEFYVRKHAKDVAKYCSMKCKIFCEKLQLICKVCGKSFERFKWEKNGDKDYCSKECYNNREPDIFVKCDGCGKEIKIFPSQKRYYDKHYCSKECCIRFGPIGKLTENKIVDNNYQRFVRKIRHCARYFDWRRSIMERDQNKCVKCGSKNKLTVHHKYVSMYEFCKKHNFNVDLIYSDPLFFDIKNGETVCRSCHAKEHRK